MDNRLVNRYVGLVSSFGTIGKRRRQEGGFLGSAVVLEQLKSGPLRRRVGFFVTGAPARGTVFCLIVSDFLLCLFHSRSAA